MTSLHEIQDRGQSIWLDYIRRRLLESGELKKLIDDGVTGVTSNPSIFQKAITGSEEYDSDLEETLRDDPHADPQDLYEAIAVKDIRMAADQLRPVYDDTSGRDGFVSLEVSPDLAYDTSGTIDEARRLWKEVDRPNLMMKVPATSEGIPAIETLIAEGINVNVTLMFSLEHYEKVSGAYLRGLEQCEDPSSVASVASVFISRVTRAVDQKLNELDTPEADELLGKVAIANAKMIYQRFRERFESDRFDALRDQGASVQRVLWASTSTKNPDYSDVRYVEELIGPDTVNTIPPETLNAFRDHGTVRGDTILENVQGARDTLEKLADLGIDLDQITGELQVRGVEKFADPFNQLLHTLEEQKKEISTRVNTQTLDPGDLAGPLEDRLGQWADDNVTRRFWSKDPTIWFDEDPGEITNRLGWLELPKTMHKELEELASLADDVAAGGWRDVVLMGMGGSSLAPEVYQRTFGNEDGYPELTVIDSTHPDAVQAVTDRMDPNDTLFIVASKSGTTTETLSLYRHFWKRVSSVTDTPGNQFIATTDPGSSLEQLALENDFRYVFRAPTDVGGRYSALTFFGLVPAAMIGMDVHRFLDRAWTLAESCAFCVPAPDNDALKLGAMIGEAARAGRDKLTFVTTSSLTAFPDWLEQLIAESTGKDGTGIVPVAHEPDPVDPASYGGDRVFVFLEYEEDPEEFEAKRDALREEGHPVITIELDSLYDLSQEMFRWEMAVAAAGAVLGIHPFNQPNVELTKDLTREAMEEDDDADDENLDIRTVPAGEDPEAAREKLERWVSDVDPDAYLAVQAYVNAENESLLDALDVLRERLLNRTGAATTFGYGPRFLHSTGQLHKGGPDTGHFLQLVDKAEQEVSVPEEDYSFNELIRAQARGDYRALHQRERDVLRIHLGEAPEEVLRALVDSL